MVSKLAVLVATAAAGVGILGIGVAAGGALENAKAKPLYANEESDALATAADANKNRVLETDELAALLKDIGYAGAPIPQSCVPYLHVGGTDKVRVDQLGLNGVLNIYVGHAVADAYVKQHAK